MTGRRDGTRTHPDDARPTCPATYRVAPMPAPAHCAETYDHQVHRGYDADGHYYTWLTDDEGAGKESW